MCEGFEPADSRHVFVEYHEVERPGSHGVESIATVRHGHHFVAFGAQKHYMGLEQVDFVVSPKNYALIHLF